MKLIASSISIFIQLVSDSYQLSATVHSLLRRSVITGPEYWTGPLDCKLIKCEGVLINTPTNFKQDYCEGFRK